MCCCVTYPKPPPLTSLRPNVAVRHTNSSGREVAKTQFSHVLTCLQVVSHVVSTILMSSQTSINKLPHTTSEKLQIQRFLCPLSSWSSLCSHTMKPTTLHLWKLTYLLPTYLLYGGQVLRMLYDYVHICYENVDQKNQVTYWNIFSKHWYDISKKGDRREINLFVRIHLKGGHFGRLNVGESTLLEWEAAKASIRLAGTFSGRTQLNWFWWNEMN